jgi:hypothetical protein
MKRINRLSTLVAVLSLALLDPSIAAAAGAPTSTAAAAAEKGLFDGVDITQFGARAELRYATQGDDYSEVAGLAFFVLDGWFELGAGYSRGLNARDCSTCSEPFRSLRLEQVMLRPVVRLRLVDYVYVEAGMLLGAGSAAWTSLSPAPHSTSESVLTAEPQIAAKLVLFANSLHVRFSFGYLLAKISRVGSEELVDNLESPTLSVSLDLLDSSSSD